MDFMENQRDKMSFLLVCSEDVSEYSDFIVQIINEFAKKADDIRNHSVNINILNKKNEIYSSKSSQQNDPGLGQTNFGDLRKILTNRFSEDDLRNLCFDLGYDYSDFPGEAKPGKARELISFVKRTQGLKALISFAKNIRPDISWENIIIDPLDLANDISDNSSENSILNIVSVNDLNGLTQKYSVIIIVFGSSLNVGLSKPNDTSEPVTLETIYNFTEQASNKQDEFLKILLYRYNIAPTVILSSPGWETKIARWNETENFFMNLKLSGKICKSFTSQDELKKGLLADLPIVITELERFHIQGITADQLSKKQKSQLVAGSLSQKFILPEMVTVPAGEFVIGDPNKKENLFLPVFEIGKYPVTVKEFRLFIQDKGYTNEEWWTPIGWDQKQKYDWREPAYLKDPKYVVDEGYPVIGISWYEALAYCSWLSALLGSHYRLPTEAEWEKASRGGDGRKYTWGNNWYDGLCNNETSKIKHLTPVGFFSALGSDSVYGCSDMLGNVYEWCNSRYLDYPYNAFDGRETQTIIDVRILKGGSWYTPKEYTNCIFRYARIPSDRSNEAGFRLVRELALRNK